MSASSRAVRNGGVTMKCYTSRSRFVHHVIGERTEVFDGHGS